MQDWPGIIEPTALALLGNPNPALTSKAKGDLRFGRKGSLSVRVPPSPQAGRWRDYETGESGGVLALIAKCLGGTQADAARWLEQNDLTRTEPPHAPHPPTPIKETRQDPSGWARTLWDRSQPIPLSTEHPARRWLKDRSLWRPDLPPPPAVRWLPEKPKWAPEAVGCVITLAARPEEWERNHPQLPRPAGVQRIPVDSEGRGAGTKRSFGRMTGALMVLGDPRLQLAAGPVLVCEGAADALALAARNTAPTAATFGTSGMNGDIAGFLAKAAAGTEIWADRDEGKNGWAPAGLRAARALARSVEEHGGRALVCHAKHPYKDPAEAAQAAGFP